MLFKFRILDYHYKATLDENNDVLFVPMVEDGLKSFHMIIDLNLVQITSFKSDVIIDEDGNPTEITRVFMSDASSAIAANKIDTFEANYREFISTIIKE